MHTEEKQDFQIMRCNHELYDEFLNMINKAFSCREPYWFIKNCGHVCPPLNKAELSDIQKNIVCLIDNKIVGALGLYPVEWILSQGSIRQTFQFGGIGQVSCLDEYRGRGVMSALLKYAIHEMESFGIELSWLQGERFRYGNYGWDFGGKRVAFHLTKKQLNRIITNSLDLSARKAQDTDISFLNELYTALPTYVIRDQSLWKRHLIRENLTWDIYTYNEHKAYICYDNDKKSEISELSGDIEILTEMLFMHIQRYQLDSVTISYPYTYDPMSDYLYKNSSYYHVNSIGNIRVNDVEKTFTKLKPFIFQQASDISSLVTERQLDQLDEGHKLLLCRRLLGFIDFLPDLDVPELSQYSFLKPLTFWIPRADDV